MLFDKYCHFYLTKTIKPKIENNLSIGISTILQIANEFAQ